MKLNFSFLVTTDNHMGFKHDDPVRRKDSFMAFAEALQISRDRDVDFILLGGDLFHMNKPNTALELNCIKILRQHMNAKSTKKTTFRRISGEFSHFERVKHGNFEDPSLSVPYPIFTIHGNHDDPTGPAGKSVCEKLAACGLINYFGKVRQEHSEKEIVVEPIVLEKGQIKIALYGIGFIPDKKLCAAFKANKVTFKQPKPDHFTVLVVHQNRVKYDEGKYVPDNVFPNWFHLIIRGHEHDAQAPQLIPESQVGGVVYQPGSTVGTSIAMREATVKQCGVISVALNNASGDEKNRYRLSYDIVDLRCHRRMIFNDIHQKEIFEHIKKTDQRRKIDSADYRIIFKKYVISKIDELLEEHQRQISQDSRATQESSGESKDLNVTSSSQESATKSSDLNVTSLSQESSSDVNVTSLSQAPLANSNDTEVTKPTTQTIDGVYGKLYRFDLPLLRVRLEYVKKTEVFDPLEVSAMFHPTQVANRDIVRFRQQKLALTTDGTKISTTFLNDIDDDFLEDINEDGMGDVEAIDLSEERKESVDAMIMNYFMDKKESERLKAISLEEYTRAVRMATQEGSVISKVLKEKKNNMIRKFESEVQDDKVAGENFNTEPKINGWFIAALGKTTHGSEDNDIADDDVMCID